MFTKYIPAIIALTGLASAVPTNKREPIVIGHDDVILPRKDGGFDVMKAWEWDHIERRLEREARLAEAMDNKRDVISGRLIPEGANQPGAAGLQARGCEESEEMQILSDVDFTDWDVAMSPVLGSKGDRVTVTVQDGYSVADSIAIAVAEEVTFIEKVLKASMTITATTTWTTTESTSFMFYLNPGEYGLVVSNPWTRRISGNMLSGCTDSPTVTSFYTDSHSSQTYNDLTWVTGPIRLCNSTTYPVPYCVGTGTHS